MAVQWILMLIIEANKLLFLL